MVYVRKWATVIVRKTPLAKVAIRISEIQVADSIDDKDELGV
jgi:hypothetical protein